MAWHHYSESDISDSGISNYDHEKDMSQFVPLSPAAFHNLFALAGDELHGYGIVQEIVQQSAGKYRLGPGTLYDNLRRLMEQGLIEEAARRSGATDPRRRYYRLTGLGRSVLSTEVERLEGMLQEARTNILVTCTHT
jgi:DNA-binding MarR family transcriptional regulator